MPSNFTSNGIDLDDIFAPREWFGFGRTLSSWGFGATTGHNDSIDRSFPLQVGNDVDWETGSGGGSHVILKKTNGTLWAVGFSTSGKLGLNIAAGTVSSPTQIGSDTDWSIISCRTNDHSMAIKTNGTLWGWGSNSFGYLGNNSTISVSSPIQIGADTDWLSIATGRANHGVKTNGTLWTWGRNLDGGLGINTAAGDVSSPVQVGSLTDWTPQISTSKFGVFTAAVKANGTLWTWGYNMYGQLGHNDRIPRSSPTQVGTDTNWAFVTANSASMNAIKTDGTLWGIGAGSSMGAGNTTRRSSPVQIGALNDWSKIAAGSGQVIASKTDGSLWAWGDQGSGKVGNGANFTSYLNSPVQISMFSDWVEVGAAGGSSFAIRNKQPL